MGGYNKSVPFPSQMLTNIPAWIRGPLLNWIDLSRVAATRNISERTEWERAFDEAFKRGDDKKSIKKIGRSGVPSELRHKVTQQRLLVSDVL